ncbi:MAG: YbaN family protein [Bacteroidetes bacterium]|nr:YbaN family protein [Bacteroidota bacterium]
MKESEVKDDQILIKSNKEKRVSGKFLRGLLIISGTLSVVIGLIGVFLPVLPTTPFLLLAAVCYAKSSSSFYNWLLNNQLFGKYIKDYREKSGIPLKVKVFALSFLWITILLSAFVIVQNVYISILLILIAIGVTIHLLAIHTLKD